MDTPQSRPATVGIALAVTGMTCSGCANTVKRVLARVAGVTGAEVDLGRGRASVSGTARPDDLVAAVQAAGFGAAVLPSGAGGEG